MEPQVISKPSSPDWESEWAQSLRTAEDLCRERFIEEGQIPEFRALLEKFKFRLPRYYAALIDKKDPACPIRRQAIPAPSELSASARGFTADPLKDLDHQPVTRITHRYPNRALLHLTPNCSMYCRYCFRKSLLNELSPELFQGGLEEPLRYLGGHPEIEEVIFSGGDPFMMSDLGLKTTLKRLAEIAHLKRLRFHTRVPVTFPSRVTRALADALAEIAIPTSVVVHFNHPKELTPESRAACRRLRDVGLTLLNQSVLLRGVNDEASTLVKLSGDLFEAGILPYYLHHPDRAAGTETFDIPVETGLKIETELREKLPGYLVPKYVIDVVGMGYKVPVREWAAISVS